MSLLEVRDLSKRYPIKRSLWGGVKESFLAVDGVSFDVEGGQTVALVGESGAGKSTVGRLVLRLIEADSGTITMDGQNIRSLERKELTKFRKNAQIIFQDPFSSLDPRNSIEAAVSEPMKVHFGTPRDERRERSRQLLRRVGLGDQFLNRYPGELSGGQLQRVAIARALALEPKFVVCDEPVAALDVSVRAQVLTLMDELQEEFGLAYLFITHDLSLVEAIADHVIVMASGRIVEHGPVDAIFDAPEQEYTKKLLDAIPVPVPYSMR